MPRIALAALLLAAPAAAWAAPETFVIDGTHTYPTYEVLHLGISTQRGRFDKTQGRIVLDRETHTGSIEIEIDTRSVSSGAGRLDSVLRGEDFFHVEKFPKMTFRSTRVDFDGDIPRRAAGELTLLGVTKPVMLAIAHFGCTRQPFFVRLTCGADASTTISRSAFGMNSYLAWIADDVKIVLQIEAVKVEAAVEPAPAGG